MARKKSGKSSRSMTNDSRKGAGPSSVMENRSRRSRDAKSASPARASRTAAELAAHLGAEFDGDGSQRVSGVASPEGATPTDLIYIDSPRHAARAASSAALCVIVGGNVRIAGKTMLRVDSPKLAFARAAAWLVAPPPIAQGIHKTAVIAASARLAQDVAVGPYAVIEDDVEIGAATQVGAFCFIGRGSRIGAGCRLYPHATIYAGAHLGREVIVHAGAVVGGDGFGYVFDGERYWKFPQIGSVELGDQVEIGCNTCVDRGALDATRLGAGVKLDNLVQVAHNVEIGEHTVVASQTGISGSSVVGSRVVLGGQVGIGDHCRVEDGAVVGGQAGILNGKILRRGQEPYWGTPVRPLSKFKEQHAWLSVLPEIGKDWRARKGSDVRK
jgi:UDP-3-O-[3-hydroxymyristoyl] glucosamine N-acyltransferase